MSKPALPKSKTRTSEDAPARLTRLASLLLTALLLGPGAVGCTPEPQDESIARQIEGEWALVRLTGGAAGIDQTYSIGDAPQTVTFDDEGRYTYIERGLSTGADTTTGNWFMTEVARAGDTLSFRFTDQLPQPLKSRRMRLVAQTRLETQGECCDQFGYTYQKL